MRQGWGPGRRVIPWVYRRWLVPAVACCRVFRPCSMRQLALLPSLPPRPGMNSNARFKATFDTETPPLSYLLDVPPQWLEQVLPRLLLLPSVALAMNSGLGLAGVGLPRLVGGRLVGVLRPRRRGVRELPLPLGVPRRRSPRCLPRWLREWISII